MTTNAKLTPTQMGILILLKAEDNRGVQYSPISGKTHLVKELFAVYQGDLGKKLLSELKFEPDNFGPFDETIYAALDILKDAGFVSFDTSSSHSIKIKLTLRGEELSDELWAKVKDEVKILFSYVKKNFNHLSSEKVLEKIYSAYPEMTIYSKSKVADKYRPRQSTL